MGIGAKHRQQQTADLCKQHLREENPSKLGLVEEFICEFDGAGKNQEMARCSQLSDGKEINEEMLKRLEAALEKSLNP